MGMEYTYAPPETANMFSTWFGVHTLCLIAEIIEIPEIGKRKWNFNNMCSMGWHRSWSEKPRKYSTINYYFVMWADLVAKLYFSIRELKRSSKVLCKMYGHVKRLCHVK